MVISSCVFSLYILHPLNILLITARTLDPFITLESQIFAASHRLHSLNVVNMIKYVRVYAVNIIKRL